MADIPFGAHTAPSPLSWIVDVLPSNQGPILRLRLEHQTGATILFLSPDDAHSLAAMLERIAAQAKVGIQIAPAETLRSLPRIPPNGELGGSPN